MGVYCLWFLFTVKLHRMDGVNKRNRRHYLPTGNGGLQTGNGAEKQLLDKIKVIYSKKSPG